MISEKKILNLEKRRNIYNFIEKNPGLHIIEISRRLNIPKTTLIYHLRFIEKLGLLKKKPGNKFTRLYISNKISVKEKAILDLLRNKIPCRIFLYMCFTLSYSATEIGKELEVNISTVSYHLKKFIDLGLIEEVKVENGSLRPFKRNDIILQRNPVRSEKIFQAKDWGEMSSIYKVLIMYKHSLSDEEIINDYIEYLKEIKKDGVIKKHKSVDYLFNTFAEYISDVIKPPFCS